MTFPSQRGRVTPSLTQTDILNVAVVGPYSYHQGDVFTPGASGWVYDSPWELRLQSIFGRGGVASVVGRKFTFDSRAEQLGNVPTVVLKNPSNGGVYTGTFGVTSLIPNRSAAL